MTDIRLGDLLNDAQAQQVCDILNDSDTSQLTKVQLLKQVFIPMRSTLEAKGVVPEYLAYWTVYQLPYLAKLPNN